MYWLAQRSFDINMLDNFLLFSFPAYLFIGVGIMARWSNCRKFSEFELEENKKLLCGKAGVYQFGYLYRSEFCPKYIGRVVWTENKWDFFKRFTHYKHKPHNSEISNRIHKHRKTLWFRVMVVNDPAWTESKYLLDDRNEFGQFTVFEWNGSVSNYKSFYYKEDWKAYYADQYSKKV